MIVRNLKAQQYATMSELNEISQEQRRDRVIENEGSSDEEREDQAEEEVPAGGTSPKEYDYLLKMPLWSLSEEKVRDLTNQMKNKKDDHDELEALHIHALWERDLDALLDALAKQEELDERDRLAHKGMKVEGNRTGRGRGKKTTKAVPKTTMKKIVGAAKQNKTTIPSKDPCYP